MRVSKPVCRRPGDAGARTSDKDALRYIGTVRVAVAAASVVALLLAGCGPAKQSSQHAVGRTPPSNAGSQGNSRQGPSAAVLTDPSERKSVEADLKMIGLTYRLYIDTNRKPPTKPQDLAKYMEGGHAMEGMTSGKYIVYWNADLDKLPTNPSTTVVGYYKDVPMAGGPVVTADWSVKDMTPDQFKAVPKAGI